MAPGEIHKPGGSVSKIEWTDTTWNPVTGCNKVSTGCKHCYAETMAKRLQAMGNPRYVNGFRVTLHHDKIHEPRRWRKPRRVFVNSMSDLFHTEVPEWFVTKCFRVMLACPQHTFQVLTKRVDWMASVLRSWNLPPNIWLGVSIENQEQAYLRVPRLREVHAAKTRFLSCEPLIGPISSLPLDDVHWVIVGGESGPEHRPMNPDWARGIRDQCKTAGVPFFMKQMGGHPNKRGNLEDIPEDLRIREWPRKESE